MSRLYDDLTLTFLEREGATHLQFPQVSVRAEDAAGVVRVVPLGLNGLKVGSGTECSVVLEDARVSRVHLELRRTADGVQLRDLKSKNGTFVGELRVFEALLTPGTVVHLGSSRLTLELGGQVEERPLSSADHFGIVLGKSPLMRVLFADLERAAVSDVPILLTGESGTGKGVLAQAVHRASGRRDGPFVVFDCGAVAPSLLESELFGHVQGAFTGASQPRQGLLAMANGGTLFLDELGELPLELQARLLRALETRTYRPVGADAYENVDVRFVGATHRDLLSAVGRGAFRKDLYFRLAVVTAEVPPLRERLEDIPLLVNHFLGLQRPPRTLGDLSPQILRVLERHDWPGNLRELSNVVTRLALFPTTGQAEVLAGMGQTPSTSRDARSYEAATLDLPLKEARAIVVEDFERVYLRYVLKRHEGNVTAAASDMGISRQFLYRMMEAHGLRGDGDG